MKHLISILAIAAVYYFAKWINPTMDWHFVIGAVFGSVSEYIKWDLKIRKRESKNPRTW